MGNTPVGIQGNTSAAQPVTLLVDSDGTLHVVGAVTQSTSPWLVKEQRPATGTQSIVAASASDVTILASNTARFGATVFNDSTALLYLLLANTTSSATVFTTKMPAGSYFEVPFGYTGVIKGIWASATGNARVTEITA